jgi:hypothetical protein
MLLCTAAPLSAQVTGEEHADTSNIYAAWFTLEDLAVFEAYEDTINRISDILFNDADQQMRQRASHEIIRTLKNALLRENSFHYGFPYLESISIVQPDDNAFRIFTWQFTFDNNTFRYYGAIQLNDSELKLFPLVDYSALMESTENLVTDNERWIGALYYNVVRTSHNGRNYYTLFGYDGNNAFSTKKLADILWFTDEGEIRFGAPLFQTAEGQVQARFSLEFKKGAAAGINFSEEYGKIMFDHLIPVDDRSEGMYFNYVPDGSYNGFEWANGKWQFVDKLFDYKLRDGEFPDESYGDQPSVMPEK